MSFPSFRAARWLATSAALILSGVAAAQPTQLRFGDITTNILNIDVLNATEFSGTIDWGPVDNLATGLLEVEPDIDNPAVLVVLSGNVPFELPQPFQPPDGNWSYFSVSPQLTPVGVIGRFSVELAAPLVHKVTEDAPWYTDGPVEFINHSIDQDFILKPTSDAGDRMKHLKIEGQPFSLAVASASFDDAFGFNVQIASVDYIHDDEIALSANDRGSNDGYFENAVAPFGTAIIDQNGLAVQLASNGSKSFLTGFPYSMVVGLAEFELTYVANQMAPGGTMSAGAVLLQYRTDSCSGSPDATKTENHGPVEFALGADGGLLGQVDNSGFDPKTYEFDAFTYGPLQADGTVYIPGFRIAGGATNPANYLLAGRVNSGVNNASFAVYGEQEYAQGDGHYAGYNLPRGVLTGTNFNLILACNNAPFTASDANKMYIRRGGVSGTLEASEASVANLPPLNL